MQVRLKVAVVIGLLGVAGMTTAAYASWSSSASGSETAQSGHDVPSHISAASFAPDLYPGGADVVTLNVDNPNPYPVIVTSISGGQAPAVNGCAAATVSTDASAAPAGLPQVNGAGVTISPHASGVYAVAGHMISDPSEACKDQSFQLSLTATLQSAS